MSLKMGIVPFWKSYDRKAIVRAAQLADDLGYDSIWVPEAWSYEQFQLLAELALNTKRIGLATGIANVFSRSAGLLAMSIATLDEISGGRAILGLGTSGQNVVENFHGVPYTKPLTRMRETVGIIRTLLAGERLDPAQSKLFDLRPFKLEMKPLRPRVPIFIASLQEKAIKEIGRIGDGWVPTFWPYKNFKDGFAWVTEGARAAGRDPAGIEIAPFVGVVPLDDVAMARSFMKPLISFYIGGMGTYYHDMFCRFGFAQSSEQVRDLYMKGQRKDAAAAVSDELVDAISICGTADHCREKLAEWHEHGMTRALVNLPPGVPHEMTEKLLRDLAPR